MSIFRVFCVLGALVLATPLAAQNRAIVIGNDTYTAQPRTPFGAQLRGTLDVLRSTGFDVRAIRNFRGNDLGAVARTVIDHGSNADRLIIVMAGHVAHARGEAWFHGVDAGIPSALDVGRSSLSLNAVATVAAQSAGEAVIAVVTPFSRPRGGWGLAPGVGPLEMPQGVTLLEGSLPDVQHVIGQITRGGVSVAQAAQTRPTLRLAGFTGARPFMAATAPAIDTAALAETTMWEVVQSLDSEDALNRYLETYPIGQFADEARNRIVYLRDAPLREAQAEETSMGLNRSARRQIQTDLSTLGFDPRGIDGVFGRGTRSALGAWQAAQGFAATGFLTRQQRDTLRAMALRREDELAREREAEDRAYWRSTGRGATLEAAQSYLDAYPQGLFSDRARQTVQRATRAADTRAWETATAQNSREGYQAYLNVHPNGEFAPEARQRLSALSGPTPDQRALNLEAQVVQNGAARALVERRLAQLRFDPGPTDGVFDSETRTAIAAFQKSVNLKTTGAIDQRTMVLLMLGLR